MKYRHVDTIEEKHHLLGGMLNLKNQLGLSQKDWLQYFESLLMRFPTSWTLFEDVPLKEEFADFWIENYGRWDHSAGRTRPHNRLGMAFAWWGLHETGVFKEIHLSDSPDFQASIVGSVGQCRENEATIIGDIGACTPGAMFDGLRQLMNIHDIWISVLGWNTHILIEFGYSVALWDSYLGVSGLSPLTNIELEKTMRGIFFCNCCNEWTISQSVREKFLSSQNSKENMATLQEGITASSHQLKLWDWDELG